MSVINLNKFRKEKKKQEKKITAQNNRVKYGLSKSQKESNKLQNNLDNKNLSDKKIDKDSND